MSDPCSPEEPIPQYENYNELILQYENCGKSDNHYLYLALLVAFLNDIELMKKKMIQYYQDYPSFQETPETQFIEKLISDSTQETMSNFTETIAQYDQVHKLTRLEVHLLLQIKMKIFQPE